MNRWNPTYAMSGKPVEGNHKTRRALIRAAAVPSTEPNSLPEQYFDWSEWRADYNYIARSFHRSKKNYSDEVLLRIRLKRLGFVGVHLKREIEFVKENS